MHCGGNVSGSPPILTKAVRPAISHFVRDRPAGVLRERCSLVCPARVASAIRPSFAACGSGPPVRLTRMASNRMFTGHPVVEPNAGYHPHHFQTKNRREGDCMRCGGIVSGSRCFREPAISHFVRDRPAGVLRERCSLVEPERRLSSAPPTSTKNATARVAFCVGGGGGNRTRVRKYSAIGSTCLARSLI